MAFFPESKGRLCPTSLFISGAWLSAQHWKVFVALFWKLCYFGTGNKAPGCAVCVLHYCAWPRGRVGLVWAGLKLSLRKGNLPLRRKAQGCKVAWVQRWHLLIYTKTLWRISLILIGGANQTQQNGRMWRKSSLIWTVPLVKSFYHSSNSQALQLPS